MSTNTGIEWTDATWNPIAGCSRVSEGCRHCYAERFAHRFSGPGQRYDGLTVLANGHPTWTGKIQFSEKALLQPLKWKRPRRVFVNSMSDLFHENVDRRMIARIVAVIVDTPRHTYQVLTKRPQRMLDLMLDGDFRQEVARWIKGNLRAYALDSAVTCNEWPPKNLWLGVSVENQAAADERIPLLLQTPAAVRFLSCEPLLGPVSLRWLAAWMRADGSQTALRHDAVGHSRRISTDEYDGLRTLDWVICGGESGPGTRPMHPAWARSLRDQCVTAGVPFFFKQWGDCGGGEGRQAAGQTFEAKKGGAILDGREWKEYPRTTFS